MTPLRGAYDLQPRGAFFVMLRTQPCIHIYIYIYTHIYIYIYTHVCICMCIVVYIYTYVFNFIYIYIYICIYLYTYINDDTHITTNNHKKVYCVRRGRSLHDISDILLHAPDNICVQRTLHPTLNLHDMQHICRNI